ncbi:hemerythrin domain-containing protein [Roseiconus nitratireducens]|nr:hemerythrin domain-containing protein [Roseiconus nitratireducens]
MSATVDAALCQIFRDWHIENHALEQKVSVVRDWMREVNQFGRPRFGETASRLRVLRDHLVAHFHKEDSMVGNLARRYPSASPEVMAIRRRSANDHRLLLRRVDDLISRLKETDPPFASWTAAMHEVDLFFDVLEQHATQESESMQILMPKECEAVLSPRE